MPEPAADFTPPPFHPRRPGLWRPVAVDPAGVSGPTRAQAAGKSWRRTSRGLHLPAWADGTVVEQRLVEVGAALPDDAGLTGWAALRWLGARWFDGARADGSLLPVTVVTRGHRLRPPSGVVVSQERFLPRTLAVIDGLPITSPRRSVAFETRHAATLVDAVRWIDLAAADDLVSLAELREHAATLAGWHGIGQLREALELADENVWSPTEVDMRLQWRRELGLDRVVTNQPVFGPDGRFVGTPDLLDLEHGVVGEYDGADPLERERRTRDITREAAFRRVGLEYVTMTAADLPDPADFLQRTRDAQSRARLLAGSRRWTVAPPSWWIDTTTVAARRSLTASQRARLLRRRAAA